MWRQFWHIVGTLGPNPTRTNTSTCWNIIKPSASGRRWLWDQSPSARTCIDENRRNRPYESQRGETRQAGRQRPHQTEFISSCLCCAAAGRDLTDNRWLVTHFDLPPCIPGQLDSRIGFREKKATLALDEGCSSKWRLIKEWQASRCSCLQTALGIGRGDIGTSELNANVLIRCEMVLANERWRVNLRPARQKAPTRRQQMVSRAFWHTFLVNLTTLLLPVSSKNSVNG